MYLRHRESFREHLFTTILITCFGGSQNIFGTFVIYGPKIINDKVYKNLERNPREVLGMAESEAKVWETAHIRDPLMETNHLESSLRISSFAGATCYIYGSKKDTNEFSCFGWFCSQANVDGLIMGARNLPCSLFPLKSELEVLIWAMHCMIAPQKTIVPFATDCSELMKMVSMSIEWPVFYTSGGIHKE